MVGLPSDKVPISLGKETNRISQIQLDDILLVHICQETFLSGVDFSYDDNESYRFSAFVIAFVISAYLPTACCDRTSQKSARDILPCTSKTVYFYLKCQISELYSPMVRSDEKNPAFAIFARHMRFQRRRSSKSVSI